MAMKLLGDLKDKVEKAENQEEAKKVIEEAGMELTDEEMDQVAGGAPRPTLDWTDTSQPESNDIGDCICEEESKEDHKGCRYGTNRWGNGHGGRRR